MELSRRQLQILVFLTNERGWLTSEKIADHLGTNKKTIQGEIKNIIDGFDGKILLQRNKRNGYFLEYIVPELQQQIADEVSRHKIYSSMNFRASAIVTFLTFQDTYISMQKLADIFFLSKTAVSIEIKTIQRWTERNPSVELEVSANKGLKIHATENMRRIFISLIGTEAVIDQANLAVEETERFHFLLPIIQQVLGDILIEYDYIISGEDYLRYARFITLTIIREESDHHLEKIEQQVTIVPIVDRLLEQLLVQTGHMFSMSEKNALANRLLELNYLYVETSDNLEIEKKLRAFEEQLLNFLDISTSHLFTKSEFLITHIKQMTMRIAAGHNVMNHFAQKTLKKYPLETYLVRRFFPRYFNLRPNLAELSYLVLYVAEALEPYRRQEKLLLISNQPFSMLNALKRNLENVLGNRITTIQIEPTYLFERRTDQVEEYAVLLSTEQEILFKDSRFSYVPNLLDDTEVKEIGMSVMKMLDLLEEQRKQQILEECFPTENRINVEKNLAEVQTLLPVSPELVMYPISSETLFACMIREDAQTKILEYSLKEPITYQQRKIKQVIYVEYDQMRKDILPFFHAVSELLV
ncbi:helix-turn-helix domain-containing protein [Candidatus Enterococcus clewellii]|uniref:PRD domain-containing protein n=1 Tax=Candidatus Enterococcus clewellii TaxID=1834193 RepID=A0A242K2L9_9ENTE|nr:HTH domain-containing protein [Enterococcus sp. 9E7_DIV0242]OTP11524.1 hypothetical protein A5888_003623 [Enterococcus sp. 9E7_DIV0242]